MLAALHVASDCVCSAMCDRVAGSAVHHPDCRQVKAAIQKAEGR
jgi:hypothetical protein